MEGDVDMVVPGLVQIELLVPDQVGHELHEMDHLRGLGVLEDGPRDGRLRNFQEVGRPIQRIHVLIDDPPHVPALAADDPFDTQPFGFGVHFGIQPFHGFVGGEEAEVAAF